MKSLLIAAQNFLKNTTLYHTQESSSKLFELGWFVAKGAKLHTRKSRRRLTKENCRCTGILVLLKGKIAKKN